MYLISLMVEDIKNSGIGDGAVITNVGKVVEIKEITPAVLKPIMEELCDLACKRQFIRKETK